MMTTQLLGRSGNQSPMPSLANSAYGLDGEGKGRKIMRGRMEGGEREREREEERERERDLRKDHCMHFDITQWHTHLTPHNPREPVSHTGGTPQASHSHAPDSYTCHSVRCFQTSPRSRGSRLNLHSDSVMSAQYFVG